MDGGWVRVGKQKPENFDRSKEKLIRRIKVLTVIHILI